MQIPNDAMTLKINMLISSTIGKVAKQISKHHQQSINNVLICKDIWDEEKILPHQFTLEKCGIIGGEVNLFYDYVPITYPLIG